jgi:hypothetical protein
MADNDKFSNGFLWIWENFPAILMAGVVAGAIVIAGAYTIDNRLSDIEKRLSFSPPRSYAPPNLQDYDADGAVAAELIDHHVVYVPVYSHIYYQGGSSYQLETTLSVRNVDIENPIYVEAVDYYDTDGKLAKSLVDRLIKLAPLQTIEFLIERRDTTGGSGANFLVHWGSMSEVNKPLIETVMVGTAGSQGICFSRTGIETSKGEGPQP